MAELVLHADERVVCFAAHPDDETIGAGGQLPFLKHCWIVHATDGSPRNMADANSHGFTTREAYARARRNELLDALRLAGIAPDRARRFNFVDQECAHELAQLTSCVAAMVRSIVPHTVLAPPYEGGHPDHDSLAFAIRTGCRVLAQRDYPVPRIVEYALYHGYFGHLDTGQFLPPPDPGTATIYLREDASNLKRRMLDCFRTQRATLAPFQTGCERFRLAPEYDFTAPPHAGKVYYETFNWGMSSARWCELAQAAAKSLRVNLS